MRTYLTPFALFISALFYCTSSFAVKDSVCWNIISIGVGSNSLVQLTEGFTGYGTDRYNSRPIGKYSGTFSCTFRRYLSPAVAIGLSLSVESESGGMMGRDSYWANTVQSGTFNRKAISFAPEVMLNYNRPKARDWHSYGYLGVGYTYFNETDTYSPEYYAKHSNNGNNTLGNSPINVYRKNYITFQICALGLSIGNRVRAFGELGFGYKGLANGGLLLSF